MAGSWSSMARTSLASCRPRISHACGRGGRRCEGSPGSRRAPRCPTARSMPSLDVRELTLGVRCIRDLRPCRVAREVLMIGRASATGGRHGTADDETATGHRTPVADSDRSMPPSPSSKGRRRLSGEFVQDLFLTLGVIAETFGASTDVRLFDHRRSRFRSRPPGGLGPRGHRPIARHSQPCRVISGLTCARHVSAHVDANVFRTSRRPDDAEGALAHSFPSGEWKLGHTVLCNRDF